MEDESKLALRTVIADAILKARGRRRRKRRIRVVREIPLWAKLLIVVLLALVATVCWIVTDDMFLEIMRRGLERH